MIIPSEAIYMPIKRGRMNYRWGKLEKKFSYNNFLVLEEGGLAPLYKREEYAIHCI
jgi:hypothetical protein